MLDIDRQRQRISLGLKQTQEDPWQRVVDTYNIGDELEGTVTKVVTFGAFVEILDGVEGLVHISELAQHHVENPREIIQPGDPVRVKILEIDSERRRLSLSIKRVEGQVLPVRPIVPPPRGTPATSRTSRSLACPRTSSRRATARPADASSPTEARRRTRRSCRRPIPTSRGGSRPRSHRAEAAAVGRAAEAPAADEIDEAAELRGRHGTPWSRSRRMSPTVEEPEDVAAGEPEASEDAHVR